MSQRSYAFGLAAGHFVRGVIRGMQNAPDVPHPQPGRRASAFSDRLRTAIAVSVRQFRYESTACTPTSAGVWVAAAARQSAGSRSHSVAAGQLTAMPALVRKHGVDLHRWYLEHTHPVLEVPRGIQLELFP